MSNLKRKLLPEPAQAELQAPMRIVIVGHVDHGKSTLVGRLLHDTNALPDGREEQIRASCLRRGMPFEWSFLTDALQAERDQGITIDTTQIHFKTPKRPYVIIDAPGHREFLKNMVSGAASSEAALLLIDAKEGVREQSRRHGYLLHLLGVKQIAVLVNKMDMVGYDEAAFRRIEAEYRAYLAGIGVQAGAFIPVSAREGEGLAAAPAQMKWYKGPCVTEALDAFAAAPPLSHLPLRLPVQDVYKFDERRIIAGRIETGSLKLGDELLFSPGNQRVRVAGIERWGAEAPQQAEAGESVGITLEEQIFVERGHMISHADNAPVLTPTFRARVFWLGQKPLKAGGRYRLKLATAEWQADVRTIERIIDTGTLAHSEATEVPSGAVAELVLHMRGLASVDGFADNPRTGRFVLLDDYDLCGGGIIDLTGIADQRVGELAVKSQNITAVDLRVTREQRALFNNHLGGVMWLTGLSGSGKSTLALELQQRLFAKGYQVTVLDGDNLRGGLNTDLGFSAADRTENIRRAGEVAALLAQSGLIVIASFIAPYREDRSRARAAAKQDFHEIYVKASLAACEQRDVKGLYKKAREGKIPEFTGISAPYEEPESPDLAIDTTQQSIDECAAQLMRYVTQHFIEPVKRMRDTVAGGI